MRAQSNGKAIDKQSLNKHTIKKRKSKRNDNKVKWGVRALQCRVANPTPLYQPNIRIYLNEQLMMNNKRQQCRIGLDCAHQYTQKSAGCRRIIAALSATVTSLTSLTSSTRLTVTSPSLSSRSSKWSSPRTLIRASVLTLSLLLLLPAHSIGADDSNDAAIIQSPLDERTYRAFTLPNGLRAVIASDPNADQAAASLQVAVGSGANPPEWSGLAHFLEHMLFLGTEQYPEAGEYKQFINAHGGNENAYTTLDSTNYYFDINAAHLQPALMRFARFFIDPTFDAQYVERERAVVHSEFQSGRKKDSRRLYAARRQLYNPTHPASRFAVGSAHTLRDRKNGAARDKLIEFYQQHYSAEQMTLAVLGPQSPRELENWVRELFAEVPMREEESVNKHPPLFNPSLAASRLNVAPQKDESSVSFLFPIESTEQYYRNKPLAYIANLIGHEGEGSLLALLTSLGWAEALSAGAGYMDEAQGVFEVSIKLTEQGAAHIDDIGALLFQYIRLIRQSGIDAWRYDEQHRLAEIAFRFAETPSALAMARRLASAQHFYARADLLRGAYMMDGYRPELITALLDALTPSNVLLQTASRDARTARQTPFYEVDFGIEPIGVDTIARWQRAQADARLALPTRNRFIPMRLKSRQLDSDARAAPELLDLPGVQAWHRFDAQFNAPRAAFYFSVESPAAIGDARKVVLTELLVRMIVRQLDAATYPARLAGLNYQLYRHSRGVSVRIQGYEDKQSLLLSLLLDALRAPRIDAAQFELAVDAARRQWKNAALDTPSNQVAHEMYALLMTPYWSEHARLAVLDELTVDDLREHSRALLQRMHLTSLSHGDVSRARAQAMNQQLTGAFADAAKINPLARPRLRELESARAYLRNLNVDHDDAALAMYFQGRNKSDAERARMRLLARLIEPAFYLQLRTNQRVGYLVHALDFNLLEVPGLLLLAQSPSQSPAQLEKLFNQFIIDFARDLDSMDEIAFEQVKRGLINRILARDQQLIARTNRYWRELDAHQFNFDVRARLARAIDAIDADEMREYAAEITVQNARKILVQTPSRNRIAPRDYELIDDAQTFRGTARVLFPMY